MNKYKINAPPKPPSRHCCTHRGRKRWRRRRITTAAANMKRKGAPIASSRKTPKIPRDNKNRILVRAPPAVLVFPQVRKVCFSSRTHEIFFFVCAHCPGGGGGGGGKKVDRRKRRAKDLRPKTVRCFGLLLSGEGR